jgi:HEAT repeat protein
VSRAGGATASAVEAATVAILQSRLRDPNQEIAETAALALGILRSEESLPIIEALLSESARGKELVGGRAVSERTRAFAAYGLGLIGTSAKNNRARQVVARALCASLPHSESSTERAAPVADVEVAAVIALSIDRLDADRSASPAPAAAPGASSPPIGSTGGSTAASTAASPGSSTAWISRQTQLRFLRGIFDDARRPPVIRAHAATAIARLGSEAPEELRSEAQEVLLGALRARSKLENAPLQSCAQSLGLLGTSATDANDRKIRLALVGVLEDADVQARCFALMALAEVGGRIRSWDEDGEGPGAYRNLITGQLMRGRGMTRPWAAIALGVLERKLADARSSAKPKQTIAGPWDSGAPGNEGQVSNAEIEAGDRSRAILRSYFASAKQRTHFGAGAVALGLCRDRKAVPMLLEGLRETSEDQGQGYIALALGMIGDEAAAAPLKELVRTSKYKPEIMEQASIALALLGDKSTAPELAEMLAKAQGQAAQASIATALGRIGDVRTIEPLLKLIDRKDLTASARAFAAAALGQVADTDPMPWYTPIALDLNYVATTGTLLAGDGSGLLEIL